MPLVPSDNLRDIPQEELESIGVVGLPTEESEENENEPRVDPKTGALLYDQEDGSVLIDTQPNTDKEVGEPKSHDDNLALYMDEYDLDSISNDLIEGINSDLDSRREWEDTIVEGIKILGIKLESPSSLASAEGSVSKAHHQMLLEAIIKYQANFVAEMLPASGPAKVNDTNPSDRGQQGAPLPNFPVKRTRDEKAEAFEKDFNYYMTVVAEEYYPDMDRMAFSQALTGNGFRKQYHCPLKRRPVSMSIPAQDLIISNDATSLADANRFTHRTKISQTTLKRLQWLGRYRKVDISVPTVSADPVGDKIKETEGLSTTSTRPQDTEHVIYECYADIDMPGFEHKDENGEETGLALPYVVTIEKESQKVLEIRRNWEEGDEFYTKKLNIVHYPLIPGLGFYAYGFLHILGNTERALTGLERLIIDAGMFANFPGGLIAKGGAKQTNSSLVVGPGQFKEVDTGSKPIQQVVMDLPYKDPSPVLQQLVQYLESSALRLAGAGLMPLMEGRADIPVGTMLAGIEQMTKPVAAIHKRNHNAQTKEFLNMKKLFMEDPTALSRFSETPARQWQLAEELADIRLVPASDPNVPSHVHRLMLATALMQMLTSPAGMQALNSHEILERVFTIMGLDNIESLFNPPQPPSMKPQDQAKATELQLKAQELDLKKTDQQRAASEAILQGNIRMQQINAQLKDRAAERASKEKLEAMDLLEQRLRSASRGIVPNIPTNGGIS